MALIICFAGLILLSGAGLYEKERKITVIDGDTVLMQKSYKIKARTAIKTKYFYKKDYLAIYDKLKEKGRPLYQINEELASDIEKIPHSVKKDAKDATVRHLGRGKFVYSKEEEGCYADFEVLERQVFAALNGDGVIILEKEKAPPIVTENTLRQATVLISSFSTGISGSSYERKHNIRLAARFLDGGIVMPGESMSFNQRVGARTRERGFAEAKIIKDGEFVAGVGGGVCQVSTTLYNAWCLAGLTVKASATHSLPVSYVKAGLDAMVSSATDLVLYNDGRYPIYIVAKVADDKLTFSLYGKKCPFEVKLRSEVVRTIPCDEYIEDTDEITDWKEGEAYRITKQPKDGLVGLAYREYYDGDALIYTETLRKAQYRAQKGRIIYRSAKNHDESAISIGA